MSEMIQDGNIAGNKEQIDLYCYACKKRTMATVRGIQKMLSSLAYSKDFVSARKLVDAFAVMLDEIDEGNEEKLLRAEENHDKTTNRWTELWGSAGPDCITVQREAAPYNTTPDAKDVLKMCGKIKE